MRELETPALRDISQVGAASFTGQPWTSATAVAFRRFEVESEMMLCDIVKLCEEKPVAFAASDIGIGFFWMYSYLLSTAGKKEVLDLRIRAMNDRRCRDRYSDAERTRMAELLKAITEKPPEPYPILVEPADAMLHGDVITAQLLAHEYLVDPEDDAAPEDIGKDLSPYTLDAVGRMRLDPREPIHVDPFSTYDRPPVFVEQVEEGAVVATAWLDAREAAV